MIWRMENFQYTFHVASEILYICVTSAATRYDTTVNANRGHHISLIFFHELIYE